MSFETFHLELDLVHIYKQNRPDVIKKIDSVSFKMEPVEACYIEFHQYCLTIYNYSPACSSRVKFNIITKVLTYTIVFLIIIHKLE